VLASVPLKKRWKARETEFVNSSFSCCRNESKSKDDGTSYHMDRLIEKTVPKNEVSYHQFEITVLFVDEIIVEQIVSMFCSYHFYSINLPSINQRYLTFLWSIVGIIRIRMRSLPSNRLSQIRQNKTDAHQSEKDFCMFSIQITSNW